RTRRLTCTLSLTCSLATPQVPRAWTRQSKRQSTPTNRFSRACSTVFGGAEHQEVEMDERLAGALDASWTRGREAQLRRVALHERAVVALLAGTLEDDERHLAIGEAHKLAGSLGSFGLDEGSRLAAEM